MRHIALLPFCILGLAAAPAVDVWNAKPEVLLLRTWMLSPSKTALQDLAS